MGNFSYQIFLLILKGISMVRMSTHLFTCSDQPLFTLPHFQQPSKKSAGGIFDPYFRFFCILKNSPPKSEIVGSMEITSGSNLPYIKGKYQFLFS